MGVSLNLLPDAVLQAVQTNANANKTTNTPAPAPTGATAPQVGVAAAVDHQKVTLQASPKAVQTPTAPSAPAGLLVPMAVTKSSPDSVTIPSAVRAVLPLNVASLEKPGAVPVPVLPQGQKRVLANGLTVMLIPTASKKVSGNFHIFPGPAPVGMHHLFEHLFAAGNSLPGTPGTLDSEKEQKLRGEYQQALGEWDQLNIRRESLSESEKTREKQLVSRIQSIEAELPRVCEEKEMYRVASLLGIEVGAYTLPDRVAYWSSGNSAQPIQTWMGMVAGLIKGKPANRGFRAESDAVGTETDGNAAPATAAVIDMSYEVMKDVTGDESYLDHRASIAPAALAKNHKNFALLEKIWKESYQPCNAVLILSGDLGDEAQQNELLKAAEKAFGGLTNAQGAHSHKKPSTPSAVNLEPPAKPRATTVKSISGEDSVKLLFAVPGGVNATYKQLAMGYLAEFLLINGRSGGVMSVAAQEKTSPFTRPSIGRTLFHEGALLSVDATHHSERKPPPSAEEVEKRLLSLLATIAKEGVSQRDFDEALKATLLKLHEDIKAEAYSMPVEEPFQTALNKEVEPSEFLRELCQALQSLTVADAKEFFGKLQRPHGVIRFLREAPVQTLTLPGLTLPPAPDSTATTLTSTYRTQVQTELEMATRTMQVQPGFKVTTVTLAPGVVLQHVRTPGALNYALTIDAQSADKPQTSFYADQVFAAHGLKVKLPKAKEPTLIDARQMAQIESQVPSRNRLTPYDNGAVVLSLQGKAWALDAAIERVTLRASSLNLSSAEVQKQIEAQRAAEKAQPQNPERVRSALQAFVTKGQESGYLKEPTADELMAENGVVTPGSQEWAPDLKRLAKKIQTQIDPLVRAGGEGMIQIVYSGPKSVREVQRLLTSKFRSLTRPRRAAPAPKPIIYQSPAQHTVYLSSTSKPTGGNVSVSARLVIPPIADDDYASLAFWQFVSLGYLADSDTGRVWEKLRTEAGMLHHARYQVSPGASAQEYGHVTYNLVISPEKLELQQAHGQTQAPKLINAMWEVYHSKPTREAFDIWKTGTIRQYAEDKPDPEAAYAILSAQRKRGGDHRAQVLAAMKAMTYEDFCAQCERYLVKPKLAIFMVGDPQHVQILQKSLQKNASGLEIKTIETQKLFKQP